MTRFKRAVVWGCGLHEHTNSYVYAAFTKAFRAMGFEAYWLNGAGGKSGIIDNMDLSNTLFLTEWQHADGMPRRKDCKYVLHNCDAKDYEGLDVLHLQTYTNPCTTGTCVHNGTHLEHGPASKVNDHGSWLAEKNGKRTLIQPWATDLLPDEIDLEWAGMPRERESHWVGTIGARPHPEDLYSNLNEMSAFRRACEDNGVRFQQHGPNGIGFKEGMELVQRSLVAPAIHGAYQAEIGYVACRVFKNISYGHVGATNCRAANELLDGRLVFNEDTYQLFDDTRRASGDREAIKGLMRLVRDKHTYVNRIRTILEVI